jgi:hypothetical protein
MSHQKVQSSYTCPENQNSQSARLEAEEAEEVADPEVAASEEASEEQPKTYQPPVHLLLHV